MTFGWIQERGTVCHYLLGVLTWIYPLKLNTGLW